MVARHHSQLRWGPDPQARGAPPDARAGDWVEPFVGALWKELDLNARLTEAGLTVKPIDVDALPRPARDLLWEWANDWIERVNARHKAQ